MCTHQMFDLQLSGAGKGPDGWFELTQASVYVDHPVRVASDHTLNIDFLNPALGASSRVAVELDLAAVPALLAAIRSALDQVPERLKATLEIEAAYE